MLRRAAFRHDVVGRAFAAIFDAPQPSRAHHRNRQQFKNASAMTELVDDSSTTIFVLSKVSSGTACSLLTSATPMPD